MPLHDWSRVPAGLFHDFHQSWSVRIARSLNAGMLPPHSSALVEQSRPNTKGKDPSPENSPEKDDRCVYSSLANRIVIKHHLGRTIAVIEIVSPGNKDSRAALREFVEKTIDFLRAGIHVLIVDLFPPSPREPLGLHKAIWDEITEEDFAFPTGKDRILASYKTGDERVAYVEPVGDLLRDMVLFLSSDYHIFVPLEPTYQATWAASPEALREAVETGEIPEPDAE